MSDTRVERRSVARQPEARQLEDGRIVIAGYAAVFGQLSDDLGGWREIIDPAAFDDVLARNPDVRCLFNHNPDLILGRVSSGTLSVRADGTGLYYEAIVAQTPIAASVVESIRRGDVRESSFAFTVAEDEWEGNIRRIVRIGELYDVSPVVYPAYPTTSVALESRRRGEQIKETYRRKIAVAALSGSFSDED